MAAFCLHAKHANQHNYEFEATIRNTMWGNGSAGVIGTPDRIPNYIAYI